MKKIKISNAEISEVLSGSTLNLPKYASQIINLANQNAQGTRPKVVGQMSDLIQEFDGNGMAEWEEWYLNKHPESIDVATDKIFEMIKNLKICIADVDRDMVRKWVEDLVVTKTYAGLKYQEAIINKIAKHEGLEHRVATAKEESQGIDGYIGGKPVSVKPSTYDSKDGLSEVIGVSIIYYTKKKSEIVVEYEL